jgi:sulfur-oxidizing protein SoxX
MTPKMIFAALVATPLLAVTLPAQAEDNPSAKARALFKSDFKPRGQAAIDRVYEDALQAVCNRTENNPSAENTKRLEADQLAKVKYPADGKLVGDWKKGERLAQSGRGMTWSDKAEDPIGGNCYNCHQISAKETAYGTVGPSLLHYGKLRGNSPEIQKYTYSKIFNAKAFNACSDMPRFGHVEALKPDQIKDLVALLLDPESPVNK